MYLYIFKALIILTSICVCMTNVGFGSSSFKGLSHTDYFWWMRVFILQPWSAIFFFYLSSFELLLSIELEVIVFI